MSMQLSSGEQVRSGKQILIGILVFLFGTIALVFAVKYLFGL